MRPGDTGDDRARGILQVLDPCEVTRGLSHRLDDLRREAIASDLRAVPARVDDMAPSQRQRNSHQATSVVLSDPEETRSGPGTAGPGTPALFRRPYSCND